MSMGWDEAHGYTMKCRGCGQTTDSTYCSTRCEQDVYARERADAEETDDILDCGDGCTYGDQNNEPNQSHGDAKHERREADREEIARREGV